MPESLAHESALDLVRLAITAAAEAGAALAGRPASRSETAILTALRDLCDALGSVRLTGEAVTAIDSAAFDRGACVRARAVPDGRPALRLAHAAMRTGGG
jgi:hypothetical protein